jgi:hypothetical protein
MNMKVNLQHILAPNPIGIFPPKPEWPRVRSPGIQEIPAPCSRFFSGYFSTDRRIVKRYGHDFIESLYNCSPEGGDFEEEGGEGPKRRKVLVCGCEPVRSLDPPFLPSVRQWVVRGERGLNLCTLGLEFFLHIYIDTALRL